MPDKNLKGKEDQLVYYRSVKTDDKIAIERLRKGKNEEYYRQIYQTSDSEKIYFSEDEVRKFSLDLHGKNIPYVDGELTIINNYFYDYWGYFLSAEGIALYSHLKRYAYGDKDWCYPSLELIAIKMDKTKPTLRHILEVLEHFGFIYTFQVYNKDKANTQESPIFKIRKTIPLLTNKLIDGDPEIEIDDGLSGQMKKVLKKQKEGLPKKLKEVHEEYIKKHFGNTETIPIQEAIDFENIYKDLLEKGMKEKRKNKNTVKEAKEKMVQLELLKNDLTEDDVAFWNDVLAKLGEMVSKPSFETWLSNTFCIKNFNNYVIYAPNEFAKDWLESRYYRMIEDVIKEFDTDTFTIQFKCKK